MLFGRTVHSIDVAGNEVQSVHVGAGSGEASASNDLVLKADAVVVACGSYSAPLLRTVGVDLPIYPGKGYSATFKILKPEAAPWISTIDDEVHCAMTRLGDHLRVAGTIELNGFDVSLDTPLARARCALLARRVEEVLPGVCDTRNEEEGGQPNYWTGLRPATPTNIPCIGRTKVGKLWVNAGHGTLGWTHGAGSGKALAALISGERAPIAGFGFHGMA
jgi:D-amino-acid dehydrogenase